MNPGDFVKLRLSDREIEGTLLESYDPSIILIKLDSGYNIGIPKDHVFDSIVLKSRVSKAVTSFKPRTDLPGVALIVTGGTIASKLDPTTGGVYSLTSVKEFAQFYPELFNLVSVTIDVPFMKSSENMTSHDWIALAECVKKHLDDPAIQGIILTHGTDTLHYTSAALSFFLSHVNKPVVLTYSQRSSDRASSDAALNLKCAAQMALSDCAEIMLVGHASMNDDFCYAFRGTKVRKLHSSRRDAFKAVNTLPIAKVWPEKIEFLSHFKARHSGASELDAVFNDKVALLTFYPGQSADIIDYYRMHGYKGLVISMAGLGHVPAGSAEHSWVPALKKAIREGIIICGAAQTIYGRLDPLVYSIGRELEKVGVLFLEDMLAETAFVKLGWVLGHRGWKLKVKDKMLENVAGEFNHLLTE
jgi:glutamyl-tRNA(Gln) amidotransferase subunit D